MYISMLGRSVTDHSQGMITHSDLGLSSRPRSYMKYLEFQIFHFHFFCCLRLLLITYYLIIIVSIEVYI